MKKIAIILVILILTVVIVGCGGNIASQDAAASQFPPPASSVPAPESAPEIAVTLPDTIPSQPESTPEAAVTLPDTIPVQPMPMPEVPVISGGAMYRGTVTNIETQGGNLVVSLQQAEGTDFGYPTIKALLNETTTLNGFNRNELQVGDYLEFYYGGNPAEGEVAAIAARRMPGADLVLFNGVLEELTLAPGQYRTGDMRLRAIHGSNEHIFHFSPEYTQFYLDFDSLKPGDRLNIFYNGVSTRSIPPQSTALEVRYYVG